MSRRVLATIVQKKNMKTKLLILTFLECICFFETRAQANINVDPEKWAPYNCSAIFDQGFIHVTNTAGKSASLWLKNINFKNGTIELDIKGKDVRGESFVGIAFHASDSEHYAAVYFRPFNFRDPERKGRSVQYVDIPGHDWDTLRERTPGKYENAVNPVPDPNDWFHARIAIKFPEIKVFLNDSNEPSLIVHEINKRGEGNFGLWIDGSEGWFKNVVLSETN
jgi:hypothetical protein